MMMYGVSYFRNKMHHFKAIPKKFSHSCSSLRPLVCPLLSILNLKLNSRLRLSSSSNVDTDCRIDCVVDRASQASSRESIPLTHIGRNLLSTDEFASSSSDDLSLTYHTNEMSRRNLSSPSPEHWQLTTGWVSDFVLTGTFLWLCIFETFSPNWHFYVCCIFLICTSIFFIFLPFLLVVSSVVGTVKISEDEIDAIWMWNVLSLDFQAWVVLEKMPRSSWKSMAETRKRI